MIYRPLDGNSDARCFKIPAGCYDDYFVELYAGMLNDQVL
jgi:hypothetical protein